MEFKTSFKKPIQRALAASVLTGIVALCLPNYYRSEARLLPVESKGIGGNLGGLASAAAVFGVSVPGGESSDANFVDVLNSRWLREQLLQAEYQYHIKHWRFGKERLEKGTLYNYLKAENMDRAVMKLGTVLSSSRDLKSKVISISAETESPELSLLVVQRAQKCLEMFLQEKGRTRGSAKVVFTEARLLEARREMDEAESLLRQFLEVNRNYLNSSDPSVKLKGIRLETELRLRQQLVTSIAMNREQALMEEKNDVPILNVLDPGNLPIDKSRPARSQIVVVMFLLVGLASWVLENWAWVKSHLVDGQEFRDEETR